MEFGFWMILRLIQLGESASFVPGSGHHKNAGKAHVEALNIDQFEIHMNITHFFVYVFKVWFNDIGITDINEIIWYYPRSS